MIKPIETRYKGYRFRSRLEARWAVFFDAMDVAYAYEPEGYSVGGSGYLPDFWIPIQHPDHSHYPSAGYWLEIKPIPLTPDQHEKCKVLAARTGHYTCILAGQPWPGEFLQQKWSPSGEFWNFTSDDLPYGYISYPCGAAGNNGNWRKAFAAARAARFEHGEEG